MRNIGRIFRDDLRLAGSNIVSVLVMLGLCLVPVLYAWINIAASWDPYANTGQMKVAVANSDDGYESALMPVRLNIGDRVVGMLRANDDYDWVFVDEREAVEGVRSGEYYAAITIPRDFSAKMMSVLSSNAEQADVGFYLNMKENPVAPVLAGEGGAQVEEDIRVKFTEAVDSMALGLASDLVSFAGGNNARDFGARLVSHLDDAAEDLDATADQMRAFANLADAASSLGETASDTLVGSEDVTGAAGQIVNSASEALDAAIASAQSASADISQQVQAAKNAGGLAEVGTETAAQLASDVASLASSVSSVSQQAATVATSMNETAKSLSGSTDTVVGNLESVRNQLNVSANKLNAASSKVRKFQDDVATAISKGDLSAVAAIVGNKQATLARWLADPVAVEKHAVYPVENYGSSMAPFYTILSIWVGAVILVAIMRTSISRERLERYREEGGRPVRNYEQYLGRYLIFAALSLLQATVVGLGDLIFLRIQCDNPLLFMVACWVCALVFSNIVYTFAVSFGEIGKALCIILLVMQVAGSGGEYPVQMMGDFFQAVYPLLPFTHGMHAMQASVAGIYGSEYAFDLLRLSAFLLPSLLLGLAVRRPLIRAADYFAAKLEETGLM